MKIFIVGDFIKNTGPANVNKQFIGLDDVSYTNKQGKIDRIIEMVIGIVKADAVIFSGLSKLNIHGIKICKIFNKKNAYLMHGSVRIENKINKIENNKSIEVENSILKNIEKIICVSEFFKNKVIDEYGYAEKSFFVNNPVSTERYKDENIKRDRNLIVCVGGGMPGKNIKVVCKAIEDLNSNYKQNYRLLVIGNKGQDIDEIKKYSFVEIIKNVKSENMHKIYKQAQIYINNSKFETFGLAPIEALLNGCEILVSKNIGAKDVLIGLKEEHSIENVDNHKEILAKILKKRNILEVDMEKINKNKVMEDIRIIMG